MNVLLIEINPFVPASTPISLGYIASYLRSQGFAVRILTFGQDGDLSRAGLRRILVRFRPDLVGFSAYQRTMLYVLGMARFIKALCPGTKTAIGGPQATFMPDQAFSDMPEIDYICRSSGEATFMGVARAVERGAPFSGLFGVSFRDDDGAVHDTPGLEGVSDLDRYPSPYLEDVFDYSSMGEAIMLTSRGCPHNCFFCYTPHAFGQQVTFHSVDRVLEEMKWIRKKGIRRFWFADPNISYDPTRPELLLDRILAEGLDVEMWMQSRADLVSLPLLKKMKRAGVSTIAFGLESASKGVLRRLGKKISIGKVAEAIRLAQRAGIEVELFTMFGLPYETFDDAVTTLEFVKNNNVKIMGNTNSQQMQIYFGTTLQRDYRQFNLRPLDEKRPAYLSTGSQYETDLMTYAEIRRVQDLWRAHSLDGGRRVVS